MNETELILKVVEDLYKLAQHIDDLIKPETSEEKENQAEQKRSISLEDVRAVLAEKSQGGKQAEVRALIVKYGADKLTDLDPTCYEALLKEAAAL